MAFPYKKFSAITKIGTGGTEDVFSATVRATSHTVVIKKLASDLRDYHGNYKKFDQNVKTLKSLHHNNIIRVFDYGAWDNAYYMSMEYVDGFDLEQLLHLPLFSRTIGLMVVFQALGGLAYAHKHGVFHCDIKPGNILVSRNGRVKLSDFGLAHVKEHLLQARTSGSVFTTPFYMPPEQASAIAEQALDSDVWAETTTLAYKETPEQHAKTLKDQTLCWDLWSVGVLLYRICTGRLPFYGKNLAQLANSIVTHQPANLHGLAPSISADLCNAIESCMIKDPLKRLASLDPVIASLQLYILSTGAHDYETTIKKHILDCTSQFTNTTAPIAKETGENRPGMAPEAPEATEASEASEASEEPIVSAPFLRSKTFKIAGIAAAFPIVFLLGALFFANISDKRSDSDNDIASLQKGPSVKQTVNFADVPFEKPAADAAPAPAETLSPHLPAAAEPQKFDSAITDVPVPKPALKPAHNEKPKNKTAKKKPAPATPNPLSAALPENQPDTLRPSAQTAENQNGVLKVKVEPLNAVISIDDVPIPSQEIAAGMQLPTGAHTISINAEGFVSYQQLVQIKPDTLQELPIVLKQKERGNGFIQVYSSPWSNIFIDGTMRGTTPTPSPITLAEGEHAVRLERDGFLPVNQTVTIKNNEITRIQVDMVKQDSTTQK